MISASDREKAVELITAANKAGARLERACDVLGITLRTYQRWTRDGKTKYDARPTADRPLPKNKLSEEEKREIIEVMNSPDYSSLPPSQVVPILADKGRYIASESTMYRTLREHCQMQHRGLAKAPVKREPATHTATGPNQVWTWDITWIPGPVKGLYYRLYVIVDIYSRKIVGWEIWDSECAAYAQLLITKAVIREKICGKPIVLHSDNGSPMKAATFQALLEKLGITKSYSRPRVSNDNPFSESLFKTLKYRPGYTGKGFENLDEARKWARGFVNWYNHQHRHSGIGFVTPEQRHCGISTEVLKYRRTVYALAYEKHPERWSRHIRKWEEPKHVSLGPIKETESIAEIS